MAAHPAVAACVARLASDGGFEGTLIAERDNSRIFRVRCAQGVVAVKECLDATRAPDREAARREFAALSTVASASTAAPLVPAPLALCAAHGAYAMSWAEGRSLTAALLDAGTTTAQARVLGAAAGEWLRRFHDAAPADARAASRAHDFVARLDYAAEVAAQAPQDRLVQRAFIVLKDGATRAAALRMPASWIHGDMKSDNLIVGATGLTGLDVQLADRNTVAYDLAPFLNHLARVRLSLRGLMRSTRVEAARDAFLAAYAEESAQWRLPLAWLRAYLLMQAVVPEAPRGALRRIAGSWTARTALVAALDEVEAGSA